MDKYAPQPWQEFRDEDLWTIKSHKVYKANQDNLNKVFEHLFPKFGGKQTGFNACIDLITKGSKIELSQKEAKFCFGMSKMTIKDEVSQHSEYTRLKFPEFCEFVGRIAYTKFIDHAEKEFHEKIEDILDLILPVYGLKRQKVTEEQVDDNTSDESTVIRPGLESQDPDLMQSLDSDECMLI